MIIFCNIFEQNSKSIRQISSKAPFKNNVVIKGRIQLDNSMQKYRMFLFYSWTINEYYFRYCTILITNDSATGEACQTLSSVQSNVIWGDELN